MGRSDRRRSVARALTLKIAASPLNPVKLDLALILLACLAVLLLLAGLETSRRLDSLILLAVAATGALWLVWRTRRIVRAQRGLPPENEHGAE